jgi:hypothetical protein
MDSHSQLIALRDSLWAQRHRNHALDPTIYFLLELKNIILRGDEYAIDKANCRNHILLNLQVDLSGFGADYGPFKDDIDMLVNETNLLISKIWKDLQDHISSGSICSHILRTVLIQFPKVP